MSGYDTILVPLDFSDCSQELIDQASSLAQPSTRIMLLHVADLPDGLAADADVSPSGSRAETAEAMLVRRSRERLMVYGEQLNARGYRSRVEVAVGDTADTIVERAADLGADLVIMGTHGRQGLARVVGGSVAAEVISRAPCPVLTVRTVHKPSCRAKSCDRCEGHLTGELRQLMAEREG